MNVLSNPVLSEILKRYNWEYSASIYPSIFGLISDRASGEVILSIISLVIIIRRTEPLDFTADSDRLFAWLWPHSRSDWIQWMTFSSKEPTSRHWGWKESTEEGRFYGLGANARYLFCSPRIHEVVGSIFYGRALEWLLRVESSLFKAGQLAKKSQ